MGIDKLLKGVQVIAVVCNQFGDTGKGKFSDYFAAHWAHVCARGTGGNNAGHTVVINGEERIFHLIPSGITNDANGQINILGNGMVIDLGVLCGELDDLSSSGLSYENLMISQDAQVIMPYHIKRDRSTNQSQKNGGIGTTGRGIGPCYGDKTERRGIRVRDLFDEEVLEKRIQKAAKFYPEQEIDVREVMSSLKPFAERIEPHVKDTISLMHKFVRDKKRISVEGAQGLGLSIEYGVPPFVTSSDCSINGTAAGVGLSAKAVDRCFGIVKFPLMTRVGGGPHPTELGGRRSEEYCGEDDEDGKPTHRKSVELKQYGIPHTIDEKGRVRYDTQHKNIIHMMNSSDPFIQGIGIRLAASEYGATTGRPRRTGWTDAVFAKFAVGINGPLMILTKADSIAGLEEFKICYGYGTTNEFSRDEKMLRGAVPEYKTYEGYLDIGSTTDFQRLPRSLQYSVSDFQEFTGGKVVAVSIGADREQTIIR